MKHNIIHIVGASGAGTTTLGQALEKKYGYTWLDTDGYFWEQTDPPFARSLPHEERVNRMSASIAENPKCVISGSLCGWGDVFIPKFDLVVFVDTPTDIRIERLQKREFERFGERIHEGGDMYEEHKKFIEWAASYDTGGFDMRSRTLHEQWLADLPCPVIRVDGTEDCNKTAAYVAEYYRQMSEASIFTPESQGISSDAVIELIEEFEQLNYHVTSFMMMRNGHKIAEFCKPPYDIDSVQLWFSVTKSITGIGIGIACDKGLLTLDDTVISFFPDKLPAVISDNLAQMRVRHLLSMTSGIHENTYGLLYPQGDWVKAFLAQDFPHEPGTYYRYSTHGSHMLAAIVERVTGHSFYDYIKTNLFEPLEIRKSTWETDSQGITAGGMGLGLTLGSVAKFAQMILNKGTYNGKRVMSEEYLSSAMTEQANDREQEKGIHTNGHGFHMRIDNDGSVFHSGAFGQLWYACPKKNIAVILTSRRTKTYTDEVIGLIQEKIISRASDNALPESDRYEKMKDYLNDLEYSVPVFRDIPQNAPALDGKTYLLSNNPHDLQSVEFIREKTEKLRVRLKYADRPESVIDASFIEPVHGQDLFVKDIQYHEQKYTSYAAWQDEKTLVLTIFYIETPYEVTYTFTFDGTNINVAFNMNVSLNLKNFECDGVLSETDQELLKDAEEAK